ncbi:MAG: hypothetical protein H7Z40_20975 [Phycisphaerae bacterium]|nr:hypothetical protein [Gemmatimonadaceae bacterium]
MRVSTFAVLPKGSGRTPRSTLFDPKRESGGTESRPYTTATEDGWRDDIKGRAMDVYVRVGDATRELPLDGYGESASQLATLLFEACKVHGPATGEEAVELLAATPLRDAIALVPTLRHCLMQNLSGTTAHVDWILAAQVALCAEFFRLRHGVA